MYLCTFRKPLSWKFRNQQFCDCHTHIQLRCSYIIPNISSILVYQMQIYKKWLDRKHMYLLEGSFWYHNAPEKLVRFGPKKNLWNEMKYIITFKYICIFHFLKVVVNFWFHGKFIYLFCRVYFVMDILKFSGSLFGMICISLIVPRWTGKIVQW